MDQINDQKTSYLHTPSRTWLTGCTVQTAYGAYLAVQSITSVWKFNESRPEQVPGTSEEKKTRSVGPLSYGLISWIRSYLGVQTREPYVRDDFLTSLDFCNQHET